MDPGAVLNAGLRRVEAEVGSIERMPLEALVELERAVRWRQNVCVVEESQGLLIRAEIRMQIAEGGRKRQGKESRHEGIALFPTFSLGDAVRLRASRPDAPVRNETQVASRHIATSRSPCRH